MEALAALHTGLLLSNLIFRCLQLLHFGFFGRSCLPDKIVLVCLNACLLAVLFLMCILFKCGPLSVVKQQKWYGSVPTT